jgi:hypothetical protein
MSELLRAGEKRATPLHPMPCLSCPRCPCALLSSLPLCPPLTATLVSTAPRYLCLFQSSLPAALSPPLIAALMSSPRCPCLRLSRLPSSPHLPATLAASSHRYPWLLLSSLPLCPPLPAALVFTPPRSICLLRAPLPAALVSISRRCPCLHLSPLTLSLLHIFLRCFRVHVSFYLCMRLSPLLAAPVT